MPKIPIDYSKTIIYKIICNDDPNFLYVGSTTNYVKRKQQHKSTCSNEKDKNYNLKLYQNIREIGGWDSVSMIEIERFTNCIDKQDAKKREQYYIDLLKPSMNMVKAYITIEQLKEYQKNFYIVNKDTIKIYKKEYQIANKNAIKIKHQIPFHCDCGSIITISHKSEHLKTIKHLNFEINNNIS